MTGFLSRSPAGLAATIGATGWIETNRPSERPAQRAQAAFYPEGSVRVVFRLVFLSMIRYYLGVKATITSKGQVTIPIGIRERLGLKTGQVLEFDPTSPFIKAVPVLDEDEMHSVN